MIRPNLILDLNDELIVDNFAGGGGASMGIEMALGRHVDHAINHNFRALGMHRINHPQTVHHCEDIWDIDPATLTEGRRVGMSWFSPDCTHFSKAKGGKPVSKKIRGLALVMLRWAAIRTRVMFMENVEEIKTWGPLLHNPKHKPDCACGKPCGYPDPKHRGRTWKAFLDALSTGLDPNHPDIPEMLELLHGTITKEQLVQGFGYRYEIKEIRASVHGAPTIRKRLYGVFRCDGMPISWPEPTHAAPDKLSESHGLKPWHTIAECIDWEHPCPSIFLTRTQAATLRKTTGIRCKRPLNNPTLRRLAAGIDRYVLRAEKPFLITLTHQGGDRNEPVDAPINTITGANRGEKALVAPVIARQFGESIGQPATAPAPTTMPNGGGKTQLVSAILVGAGGPARAGEPTPVDRPGKTVLKNCNTYICASNMVKLRGDPETHQPGHPADDPAATISASGQHHAVSCAYLAQHNAGFNTTPGHDARTPITAITSKGSQQQVVSASLTAYYGTEKDGQAADEPARTITEKARLGLGEVAAVTPGLTPEQLAGASRVAKFLRSFGVEFEGEFATVAGYVIIDIGMRMLTARELFRAQGFPDSYVIDRAWVVEPHSGEIEEITLTNAQQIEMCGNSVCPPVACAIVRANVPELSVWCKGERRRYERSLEAMRRPLPQTLQLLTT